MSAAAPGRELPLSTDGPARPLPEVTLATGWFWKSGADGRLRIQACRDCDTLVHPAVPICQNCRSRSCAPVAVSGIATVVGFTVNHHRWLPGFDPPYVIANALAEDPSVHLTTMTTTGCPANRSLGDRPFLDNVEVPVDRRLGEEGAGWRIEMTTVAYERGPGDVGFVAGLFRRRHVLEPLALRRGRGDEPELRKKFASAYVRGETLRLNVLEQLWSRLSGKEAGMEGSVSKMIFTDATQYVEHVALDLAGAAVTGHAHSFRDQYLASRPVGIYGGTSQVQRNIIAQRMLGMPTR